MAAFAHLAGWPYERLLAYHLLAVELLCVVPVRQADARVHDLRGARHTGCSSKQGASL